MTGSNSKDTQNKQSANASEAELAKRRAGKTEQSSEDATSRVKAGKDDGAGGGAKQKQKH